MARGSAVIGARDDTALVQPSGDLVGITLRKNVDNSRAGQVWDLLGEPCKSSGLARQPYRLKRQGIAHQRATLNFKVTQLFADILDYAVIRGRGSPKDWQVIGHTRRF